MVFFWDGSGDGGGGRGALLKSHTLQMGIVQVQRGICLFLVGLNLARMVWGTYAVKIEVQMTICFCCQDALWYKCP